MTAEHPIAPPEPRLSSPWRLRFWAIFLGQSLSLLGSSLTQFVLLWWITDTTGSVGALASAGTAALLPQALLSPLGGACADRYSRRWLMLGADAVCALSMLVIIALFASGAVAVWHLYVLLAVRSAMQAFQLPAAAASVATLVPRSFLPRAAALNQTLSGLTMVAAAPLGALVIGVLPLEWALSIDVATAVLAIVPLLLFGVPAVVRQAPVGSTSITRDLRDGVVYVWGTPGLRSLYAVLAVVVLVIMPAFTLLPLLVKVHFQGGAAQVALLEGLSGAGMVAGGLLMTALAPRRQLPWVFGGFALACGCVGAAAALPADLYAVAAVCWALNGLAFVAGNAPLVALLQLVVPHALQGRVLSLLGAITNLAAPIGLALATPLGHAVGVRWLLVLVGAAGAACCLMAFALPSLRTLHPGQSGDGLSSGRAPLAGRSAD